ncbi:MAG: extracellular solute-binding protein [Deltaproteobacteria bacterium]|jgi:tungstate transport system substrate-binding protein|nr:extracellular solute-binding protein [Deltaproteobacteria bacterium]
MKRILFVALGFAITVSILSTWTLAQEKIIEMSTTTSTQASGLLDVLLPELEKDTGIKVKVIAKGTGAAIRDGMDGNVDVIFVHAKAREVKFVKEGYGTKRYAVMHNDFVILGSKYDPAKIRGLQSAAQALQKIADAGATFISRGDDSGTHTKEQALWKGTGLTLDKKTNSIVKKGKKSEVTFVYPAGSAQWYLSIGQGMGKALTVADEKQAYILADRGTYIKYKFGRDVPIDLDVLCEGDPALANPYGVIPINPQKHPHVKADLAREFAEWLVSKKGQKAIAGYRLLGKPLFYPDALD